MTNAIAVTRVPAEVEAARRILTAVLAADPTLDDSLRISEALGALLDVHPPYPPLGLEDDPTEPEIGIPIAMSHLGRAIELATAIPERCRYGVALVLLRRALGQLETLTEDPR